MFAAFSQAVSNAMVSGIKVRNETAVPLLVVCSQLTPLHWGRVLPGETWNEGNPQKMGKVWFTVTVSAYTAKEEPTAASVAASIAAMTVATPLILLTAGFGTVGALAVGGYLAEKTKSTNSSFSEELSFSVVGTRKDGVYSDGSTLFVRAKLNDAAAYELYYAGDDEMRERPFKGPPTSSEIEAIYNALMRVRQERAAAASLTNTPEALREMSIIQSTKVGIQVRNETSVPLLIVLSQLTPLRKLFFWSSLLFIIKKLVNIITNQYSILCNPYILINILFSLTFLFSSYC
jgi:hypothetical protein